MTRWMMVLIAAIMAVVQAAPAMAMWCSQRVIREGDSQHRVRQYCGEPQSVAFVGMETIYRNGPYGRSKIEQPVEKWFYDMGAGRFLKILVFRGDILIRVEDGERQ